MQDALRPLCDNILVGLYKVKQAGQITLRSRPRQGCHPGHPCADLTGPAAGFIHHGTTMQGIDEDGHFLAQQILADLVLSREKSAGRLALKPASKQICSHVLITNPVAERLGHQYFILTQHCKQLK